LVASIPSTGDLTSMVARDDLLVGASGNSVLIFDIRAAQEPILAGSFQYPFPIVDVALQGDLVAAAGSNQISILDIRDPAAPVEFKTITFSGDSVNCVAMDGNLVFAGLGSRKIVSADALTGVIFEEEPTLGSGSAIGADPSDIVLNSRFVYVAVSGGITTFQRIAGAFLERTDLHSNSEIRSERLFLGKGILLCTLNRGYMVLDLSDPAKPVVNQEYNLAQFGWKDLLLNGSGIMLAATSPNSTFDGPHNVDLYDVGSTGFLSNYLQTVETPDVTKSLTLYNSMAFAGGTRLNVINYLAQDTGTIAPSINLVSDQGNDVSQGAFTTISADVGDDVQVRNVEFYVDGQLASKDGNYPFSLTFQVPLLSEGADTVSVEARAYDTAGNSSLSNALTLNIGEDLTPPVILAGIPKNGGLLADARTLGFLSSKNMDPASLGPDNVFVVYAGNDLTLGTADDTILDAGIVELSSTTSVVYLKYPDLLQPGRYQLNVTTGATDLAGNPLQLPFQSTFFVLVSGGDDTDGDGLPDELENTLPGYDPLLSDSDGDGLSDGEEDFDGDGINNLTEYLILGTDPTKPDTDGDGLTDRDEIDLHGTNPLVRDTDEDGLNDRLEIQQGLNPLNVDSDGDLLDDGTEYFRNYDPKVANISLEHAVSAPVIIFFREGNSAPENLGAVSKPVAHENQ
jgi:hypothetical protein